MLIFPNMVVNIGLIICGINFELTNWLSLTTVDSIRGTMFMDITDICIRNAAVRLDNYNDMEHNGDNTNDSNDSSSNDYRNVISGSDKYKGIKIRVNYNSENETFNKLKSNFYNDVDEAANDCMHLLLLEWYKQSYNDDEYVDNYKIQSDSYRNNNAFNAEISTDGIANCDNNNNNNNNNIDCGNSGGQYDRSSTRKHNDHYDNFHLYGRVIFPKVYYMNTQHFSGNDDDNDSDDDSDYDSDDDSDYDSDDESDNDHDSGDDFDDNSDIDIDAYDDREYDKFDGYIDDDNNVIIVMIIMMMLKRYL